MGNWVLTSQDPLAHYLDLSQTVLPKAGGAWVSIHQQHPCLVNNCYWAECFWAAPQAGWAWCPELEKAPGQTKSEEVCGYECEAVSGHNSCALGNSGRPLVRREGLDSASSVPHQTSVSSRFLQNVVRGKAEECSVNFRVVPQTSHISIPWELIRNADFWVLPRGPESETWGVLPSKLCLWKTSRWFWWTWKICKPQL